MSRVTRSATGFALSLALLAPSQADAQASQALTGVGYGVAGMALGLAVTSGATCTGGFMCIPPEVVVGMGLGLGVGFFGGRALASSANRAVAEGRAVDGGHLGAIVVGTVLGGATVGAVLSSLLINGDGTGTVFGSDERTVALFTLAGAGLGILQLQRNWGALTGRVEIQPTVGEGWQPGVAARIRF